MEPYLYEGDNVLTFNWFKSKDDDVVVFKQSKLFLIKRVAKIDDSYILVRGDNKELSTNVGPVKFDQIVGKVVLKY